MTRSSTTISTPPWISPRCAPSQQSYGTIKASWLCWHYKTIFQRCCLFARLTWRTRFLDPCWIAWMCSDLAGTTLTVLAPMSGMPVAKLWSMSISLTTYHGDVNLSCVHRYDLPEKRAIARDYLIPKALEATGLTGRAGRLPTCHLIDLLASWCSHNVRPGEGNSPTSLRITDGSLDRIIKWSTDITSFNPQLSFRLRINLEVHENSQDYRVTSMRLYTFTSTSCLRLICEYKKSPLRYCREAGVRHLEKEIEKICRKGSYLKTLQNIKIGQRCCFIFFSG